MLKIFNTLTKQLEEFKPIEKNKVRFYHCGPTVYWVQHLGNIRAMVLADVIYRTLVYLGYNVTLVRNYTDVGHLTSDADEGEDKMEKAAKRDKLTPQEVADKYIAIFEENLQALNTIEPSTKPRATEYVKEIQEMVQQIINNGFAYSTPLAVYFDVSKAKDYTRLSGQYLEKNLTGAGSGEVSDSNKKHPADFALWVFKAGAHQNALQTWPSPFITPLAKNGEGFPGWHIECSAMAKKYLGNTLDIHMGGIEHIPVHHTNEIAQSEAANGEPFVHYWLHNEHLVVDNAKMAKSEGTSYILQDVLDRGHNPLSLRYYFLGAHYRSKQNFNWGALTGAQTALIKVYDILRDYGDVSSGTVIPEFHKQFITAICDDFNTPQALAVMWDVIKSDNTDADKRATLLDFDNVFGLKFSEIKKEQIIIPHEVKQLLEERDRARKNKDFKRSDELREQITRSGFVVEDTEEGQRLVISKP